MSTSRDRLMGEARVLPDVETWMRDIVAERARQKAKGYDADHDREHGFDGLLRWAQEYARRGNTLAAAALVEAARELLAEARVLPLPATVAQAVAEAQNVPFAGTKQRRIADAVLTLLADQPTVDAVRREAKVEALREAADALDDMQTPTESAPYAVRRDPAAWLCARADRIASGGQG